MDERCFLCDTELVEEEGKPYCKTCNSEIMTLPEIRKASMKWWSELNNSSRVEYIYMSFIRSLEYQKFLKDKLEGYVNG